MAKKSKTSIDDFTFYDEEEIQPFNIIAKSIQSSGYVPEPNLSQNEPKYLDNQSTSSVTLSLEIPAPECEELDSISPAIRQHIDSISPAIRQHIDSISPAIRQHIDSISPAITMDKIDIDSKSPAESPAIRQHIDSKSRSFFEVVGMERKLLFFIFKQVIFNGGNSTRPISTDELKSTFGLSAKRLANIVERLISKKTLLIEKNQRGRASWRVFSLPKNIYQEIRSEVGSEKPYRQHIDSISPAESPAESPADRSSSSSINITTTTTNPTSFTSGLSGGELSDAWLQIEIPENVKVIGFGQTQIKQLFQLGTLSALEVQESLEAFGYDLDGGQVKSRGSKLSFLMGILRRSGAYISEDLVNELKVQVENNEKRKREMADLEKRQAQDKLTAKAQEIASQMTERDKLSLVPENGLVKIGSVSHERLLMAKILEDLLSSKKNSSTETKT